jgi:hypothetical protein
LTTFGYNQKTPLMQDPEELLLELARELTITIPKLSLLYFDQGITKYLLIESDHVLETDIPEMITDGLIAAFTNMFHDIAIQIVDQRSLIPDPLIPIFRITNGSSYGF